MMTFYGNIKRLAVSYTLIYKKQRHHGVLSSTPSRWHPLCCFLTRKTHCLFVLCVIGDIWYMNTTPSFFKRAFSILRLFHGHMQWLMARPCCCILLLCLCSSFTQPTIDGDLDSLKFGLVVKKNLPYSCIEFVVRIYTQFSWVYVQKWNSWATCNMLFNVLHNAIESSKGIFTHLAFHNSM